MKKGDPPLAVLVEDRERSPEEKLLISVLAHQVKDYIAAKEVGHDQDLDQKRRNVKLMIHHHIERKFKYQWIAMNIIEEYSDQAISQSLLRDFLGSLSEFIQADFSIFRYRRIKKVLELGMKAEAYIFDNGRDATNDVFSFSFICEMIGLDPQKFRDRLRTLDRDDIEKIKSALRGEA